MLDRAPRFSAADARRMARDLFGVDGEVAPLPSERDQNWLITRATGLPVVLKIANGTEIRALIEAQQAAMSWLHDHAHSADLATRIPTIVHTSTGNAIGDVEGQHDARYLAWMITAVDGMPMVSSPRHSTELLRDLGRVSGAITTSFAGFDHPAIHRDFYWDLANARRIVAERRSMLTDATIRSAIDRIVAAFDRQTAPLLDNLPRGVIHGDLNDHNILVGGGDDPETRNQRVTGIVDFGDIVHSYAIADVAIAMAYVMAVSDDPVLAAAEVVSGRHEIAPLSDDECAALFGLATMRLCASACIAASQERERPDNRYLGTTQPAIRLTLPQLAAIPFGLAEGVFREACGWEPSRTRARVVQHLRAHADRIAPVMGVDLRQTPCLVLDWSVASPMLGADATANVEPVITERVFTAMRDADVSVAVGRYDEPRLLYSAAGFASAGGRIVDERRTVHIGLDLFAKPGAPVFAPLDGVVHAFATIDAPLDYGNVILLSHTTDDGLEFLTLYGHLSKASLAGLKIGQSIAAGDRFAELGEPSENGGWTPHLHLQIITELIELGTDYPGVARPSLRRVWTSFCPDPNLITGVPVDRFPAMMPPRNETLSTRRAHFGGNVSIAYREPLKIARGWKQYLFDDDGRRYVDAYNNVPHVGHCHPRVVDAATAQMRVLNTNTRYLSDVVNEYATRLAATFTAPLEVCYFVSSASEANELAVRLARAHTGARDMIVLEAAYHGNTTTLVDLSPYKHAGPGGRGAPDWVHVAPLADDYRGAFKRDDPKRGEKYAASVGEIAARLQSSGTGLAGFLAESCPSVGGQILFPPGYLKAAYAHVHRAGGVCIADEVQTGLGRIGSHFWAFESQGVVPDIVVLGKPVGNGHPLAAVVTTRAIADSFDNGMEYFSTFGGNTVSCAVGLAVLDVMRDERLQDHARAIGDRMLASLRPLADRYPIIGDVRGSGLFLGVELVRDRATLEPAGAEASFVVNRMRERGVLVGTDGPYHNVVKIRPPMPFTADDADLLVNEMERALNQL